MKYSLVQESRVGTRSINQDRVGHWHTPQSLLMVVADGLGGHSRGEVAAEIAVQHLGAAFQREARPTLADPQGFLERTLDDAHALILSEAQRLNLVDTPRTVIVACVVQEGQAWWCHIGDCRLYLFRKGRLEARTRDHTVVQQLVDTGRIREEAMATHPERNRLLQCLGGMQVPRAQPGGHARLVRDDVLLLCSDGFWGPLTQRQLLNELLSRALPHAIAELVDLAEARAGDDCDNVSVLAMTYHEEGEIEKAIAEIRAAVRGNPPPRGRT
jgi:PPM family protein phosphatase